MRARNSPSSPVYGLHRSELACTDDEAVKSILPPGGEFSESSAKAEFPPRTGAGPVRDDVDAAPDPKSRTPETAPPPRLLGPEDRENTLDVRLGPAANPPESECSPSAASAEAQLFP